MHQNAGNCINFFQIFWGEDPQTPCQNMSPPLQKLMTPLDI